MADGSLDTGEKLKMFAPRHPYQIPGQWAEEVAERTGPTCDPRFRKYAQCLLPMMYARIWVVGTVATDGGPIVFSTISPENALSLFSNGAGGPSTTTGLPTGIQNNFLTIADTSVAQPRGRDTASVAPDNNMIFRWFGFTVSGQNIISSTTAGGKQFKTYNTGWARAYETIIQKSLMQEVVFQARFGSTTEVQNFGTGMLYNTSRAQDGEYNSNAGNPIYTMCEVLSGSPEDSDKMTMYATLPSDIYIDNDSSSPTVTGSIYFQMQAGVYGWLECRDGGGVCPVPSNSDVKGLKDNVEQLRRLVEQMARGQLPAPAPGSFPGRR